LQLASLKPHGLHGTVKAETLSAVCVRKEVGFASGLEIRKGNAPVVCVARFKRVREACAVKLVRVVEHLSNGDFPAAFSNKLEAT